MISIGADHERPVAHEESGGNGKGHGLDSRSVADTDHEISGAEEPGKSLSGRNLLLYWLSLTPSVPWCCKQRLESELELTALRREVSSMTFQSSYSKPFDPLGLYWPKGVW